MNMPMSQSIEAALQTVQARRKIIIPVLLVAVYLYWVGLYLYVPTLPLYIQSKTADLALVGTALSMYGLWQLISRLPLGIVVDWVGKRKPFVLAWLVLVAVGDWVLGTAPDISSATLGRALVGVSAGCWVPLVVMFSGLFKPGEAVRATGILSIVGALGRITSTAANGWLNDLGGYTLAFKLAALAALLGALIVALLPDVPSVPHKPSFPAFWNLLKRRDVLIPSLLSAVLHTADFAATFTFIPILARQLGASDVLVSTLLSLNLVMGLIGSLVSASLGNRLGYRLLAVLSFILISIGVAGAALAPVLIVLFGFQFCIGMGFGLAYPLLMGMSIKNVDNSQRTTAMGLHQSLYSIGMFAGPWASGLLASSLGIAPMFGWIAAVTLVAGIAGSLLLDGRKNNPVSGT